MLALGNFGAQSYDALELSLNGWGMEITTIVTYQFKFVGCKKSKQADFT